MGGGGGGAGGGAGGIGGVSILGTTKGGDGGAGGLHGNASGQGGDPAYTSPLHGDRGGDGQDGADATLDITPSGGGGGGGAGGYGLVVVSGGAIDNQTTITGGDGGNGGKSGAVVAVTPSNQNHPGGGGHGGGGGLGIWMSVANITATNEATVTGGNGGKGGTSPTSPNTGVPGWGVGNGGAGGAGIYGAGTGVALAGTKVVNSSSGHVTGGRGGDGGDVDTTPADIGGALTDDEKGANGGSGGAGIYGVSVVDNQGGFITGGMGGNGGVGSQYQEHDGYQQTEATGGAGGAGVVALPVADGSKASVSNSGSIIGGKGGDAGNAQTVGANAKDQSSGGRGGDGIQASGAGAKILNESGGSITGGSGGAGGTTFATDPSNGNGGDGGDGINGTGLNIINSGTITGGIGGVAGSGLDGNHGYAIHMLGGGNTLELHSGSNIVGNVLAEGTNNTFILGGDNSATFNGQLSTSTGGSENYRGFQTFIKEGDSKWTLQNTYNVDWQIRGGVLEVDDQGTLDNGVTIDTGNGTDKGFLSYNQNGATPTTFGGKINGDGGLRKEGTGELVLTGNNSYGGGTDLNSGALSVDEDIRLGGSYSGLNFNGGTLKITGTSMISTGHAISWGSNGGGFDIDDANNTFTITTDLTGNGSLTKDGAGTLSLTNLNSYAGLIAINDGKLQIGNGNLTGTLGTGSTVSVASGAQLVFDRSDDGLVISQTINGNGGLEQKGSGKTTLIGDNTYTGETVISAGTLQIGQNGAAGSLAPQSTVNIAQDAKFIISHNDASFDFTNVIQGDGQVVIDGDGTVALTNINNTYGGGTELKMGVLNIGSDQVLGTGVLTFSGGTLRVESPFTMTRDINLLDPTVTNNTFDTTQNLWFKGAMTGAATSSFTKTGAGKFWFDQSADTTAFKGIANVNDGVMQVDSTFGGRVNVNGGGVLGGNGTVGDTHVVAGGTLSGRYSTTLTIDGDLTVDRDSTVQVNIGPAPFSKELFNVKGELQLHGTLDVMTGGLSGPGVYRIFNYSGTMDDTDFVLGNVDGVSADQNDWEIQDSISGKINLISKAGLTFTYRDGTNLQGGDGEVDGGDGFWNTNASNWTEQDGSFNGKWTDSAVAYFKGSAGHVEITDDVNAAGLIFETTGYTITGAPLNLVQASPSGPAPVIQVGVDDDHSITATIDTVLQGTAGLNKTGAGTLVLTKDAQYTGVTTVSQGTLQLGNGGDQGIVVTDIVLNGDHFDNGILVFDLKDAQFNHSISGNGEVIQRGTGTTTLGANNSFSGGLTVETGTVKAGIVDTAFGTGRAAVEKGATLDLAGFNQTIGGLVGNKDDKGDGDIQLGTGILTLNQDFSTNFSGKISGTGGLVKNENGTLTLSGINNYSGVTTVNGGSLVQGAKDAFSGTSAYAVANGATVDLGGFATGMQSLENDGTVDFGGTGGTALNIAGDYAGGGTLVMSTVLGADNSTTDQMKVGGNTSGTTSVVVKNRGGLGAATVNGIELIDIAGNSGGTFNLQGDYTTKDGQQAILTSSAYAYTLQKGDASGSNTNDWYLVSQYTRNDPDGPNPPACDDPNGCPENPSNPSGPSRFSPAAPVYTSYAASMQALNQLPTLQQRRGDRYLNKSGSLRGSSEAGETDDRAIWARIEGAHNRLEPNTTAGHVQQDINTVIMQAGVDGQFYEDESGRLIAGITGQYGNGRARTSSNFDDVNGGGELNTQGWGLGGTITWYGNDGFYVDAQAQANWYKTDLRFGGGNNGLTNDNNGFGYAFSVETGKRFDIDENWSLTPQAQLMFSSVDFDTFSDSYGATVSNRDGNSLNGRLGLAANYANSWQGADSRMVNANVYGIANLYQEFLGGTSINYGGTRMKADQDRTWAGIGFGGTYAWADNKYSVYGEGTVNTSLNHFADSYAVKGNVGFKVNW
ncbi:autotransporter outer membrane beta-barrel domain-containing protein [Ochrobactrum teleogrylli]|uniref:Autotransporter outer membrane beta-barrel domain-containing protein n=1 Tax=Ochrobactrum teleogrylli TaxID=2479765 RepID=A0ABD5JXF5_9HYPH